MCINKHDHIMPSIEYTIQLISIINIMICHACMNQFLLTSTPATLIGLAVVISVTPVKLEIIQTMMAFKKINACAIHEIFTVTCFLTMLYCNLLGKHTHTS